MSFEPLGFTPTLAALLAETSVRFVDIGGRGTALPQLIPYAAAAHYYSCEPDAAEAERLRSDLPQRVPWRGVTVIDAAIAGVTGRATLNRTRKAGMSSLLEPDPDVAAPYFAAKALAIDAVADVPVLTLDAAARQYGFEEACFLKLDTQGTELDILQSGDRLVRESVLGVYVEASFRRFYRRQCLFADVDTHLRDRGFSLFGLYRTLFRRAGYRTDVYSRRTAVWAHCVYLREPQSIVSSQRGARSAADVLRLLLLCLAFKYYDLAFEIVEAPAMQDLFPGEQWRAVAHEVETVAREQTRRLVKNAARAEGRTGDLDDLLSRTLRDNRYVD